MSKIYPIRTKEDFLSFLIAIIFCVFLGYLKTDSWEEELLIATILFISYVCVSLPSWLSMQHGADEILNRSKDYIKKNKVLLNNLPEYKKLELK